ncbi:hypothetical protein PROFUN_15992 [Planoprotostelium fungivorum]|uniref:Uncharacterized protein n=1 Tax=Planoprotostelium fungivorum TaxID=1890364 RepID=A0A2P6MTC5_9EUKA|nr:hypothetical protein PROFUN_15992 [Planoprotostelium fungivorum]
MTAQLNANPWSFDFSVFTKLSLLSPNGPTLSFYSSQQGVNLPPPQWTQGPHTTQACPYLPVHRCPEGLPYPSYYLNSHISHISYATFFLVSPLDCRVQSYQLASNGLVAPNRVKLISECT